jgi:hypothetical protein
MARKLIVEILGDTSGLERSTKKARTEVEGLGGAVKGLSISFATLARSVLVVEVLQKALEGLHEVVHAGTDELKQRAVVQAQVNAALKSTGDVANVSAKHIDDLALSMSNLSGFGTQVVKAGEATLLTFTNIRNYAGAQNKIFDRATLAAVNYAAKSGKSLTTASLAIGKALQDPAKAASSLRRAQVVLTEGEKQAIATSLKYGDTLGAQRDVLDALQKRYGGQAKALGETLPGEINVLRSRFKDLAGDLGSLLVPAISRGVRAATDFVRRLSEAQGVRAKLRVVFSGLKDLGETLVRYVREGIKAGIAAVERIDWGTVEAKLEIGFERAEDIARRLYESARAGIAKGIDRLKQIDWRHAVDVAAQKLGDALVFVIGGIANILQHVDWQRVGRDIATGIGAALVLAGRFLQHLPWKQIGTDIWSLLVNAIKATAGIIIGIGEQIGEWLLRGIEAGFEKIGRWIETNVLKLAIKLITPFTYLPGFLGAPFTNTKNKLKDELSALQQPAFEGGQAVGQQIAAGIAGGMQSLQIPESGLKIKVGGKTVDITSPFPFGQPADITGLLIGNVPDGTTPKAKPGAANQRVTQRNTWFDAMIARQLDRVQDLSLRNQLSRLKQIADEVRKRLDVTGDVTRRLTLQDKIVEILRQEKSVQDQITQSIQQQNQALKDRADAIKSAILDRLQQKQTNIENKQALDDAVQKLKLAQALGGPQGIKLAQRDVEQAKFAIQYARDQAAAATLRRGPHGLQTFRLGDVITINVHGSDSPQKVAQEVAAILARRQKHSSVPSRGPSAGSAAGQH